MPFAFAALYLLTLASFLVPMVFAFLHWRRAQAPLALKFLRQSLAFAGFTGALAVTYLILEAWPTSADRFEIFGDTLYFVLYAVLTLEFSRLLYELLQRPWAGWHRRLVEGLAWLGLVLALSVHGLVFDNEARVQALRWVLNGLYLPLFLGWMLYLFVAALIQARTVSDRWKRTTLAGASGIFVASTPLFVIDALWPLFQMEWQLIPRGLNLHIVGVLAWNGFWAFRWLAFPSAGSGETQADVPPLPDHPVLEPLSSREREVVRWVLAGLGNQEVAQRLGLSLGTVKNHLYHAFNKTGASSRKELRAMVE